MELPPELRIVDNANNNKTGVLHQYKTQPVSYLKENSVKFEIPNVLNFFCLRTLAISALNFLISNVTSGTL